MNIRKLVNDYVECDSYEMIYKDNKLKIYYYNKIEHFSDTKIKVLTLSDLYIIEGNNLAIETMFKDPETEYLKIEALAEGVEISFSSAIEFSYDKITWYALSANSSNFLN